MDRGEAFEAKVGRLFESLRVRYPTHVKVTPQFPTELASGRRTYIDVRVTVDYPHEEQSYYFELQSRDKYRHELADKIESIRRDTPLSTFSFVHESPISPAVAAELEARNIVAYDLNGLVRFVEGIELQLLQLVSADRTAEGLAAHDEASRDRLTELVERLASSGAVKKIRHFGSAPERVHPEQHGSEPGSRR